MDQHQTGWPVAVSLGQNFVSVTLGTMVIECLVIFVTGFLLGLLVGWRWKQGRHE